jgi:phage gp29-like protein
MTNALSNIAAKFGGRVSNSYPGDAGYSGAPRQLSANVKAAVRNLSNTISPVQLQRLKHDITMWREAVAEAELAWYPHRVRMQRMYIDTILNGHVFALMERRKDLSLLRDFELVDDKEKQNEEWTNYFAKQAWFRLFMEYALDALFFGYSLISLGDIISDSFPKLETVRRWNISPDRENVTTLVYSLNGTPFLEKPWANWHIWVPTPSQTGSQNCGYGLFYNIALYEIFLRNTLGFNADFVELYAMPYRVGKTTKTDEAERAELYQAIENMGSAGFALIDPADDITFLEGKLGGTGFQAYDNLEGRLNKVVSKIILGHGSAIDETPGKLGHGGDKEDNPVMAAMMDKQTKDGRFLETIINGQLIPKMRKLGFNIPNGLVYRFKNDQEKEAFRKNEDVSNQATADVFLAITQAGGKPDWKYFSERTGIPVKDPPVPLLPKAKDPLTQDVKNKLEKFYAGHKH